MYAQTMPNTEKQIVQASDPEMDIEVLKSVPPKFEVHDEKSANWVVRRVTETRQYAVRVKEWAELEVARAAREEKTLLFLFGRQIESWAQGEIANFNGRRKSLNLPAGTVGFRTLPFRLVIDDEARVLSWAKSNLPDAVMTVEKLSKSILNDYSEKTGVIPDDGAHVEPEVLHSLTCEATRIGDNPQIRVSDH